MTGRSRSLAAALATAIAAAGPGALHAQPAPAPAAPAPAAPAADPQLAELQRRIEALEARLGAAAEEGTRQRAELEGALGELAGELDAATTQLEETTAKVRAGEGRIRFVPAGTTTTTLSLEDNDTWRYAALFAPHFFWSFYDRALFEAHLDLRVADGTTGVNLEFAALWLVLTDHLILGAGKILTPFGFYNEQLHTSWLNRLPDEPLAVADHVGPSPTHFVGLNLRGVHHVAGRRVAWSAYVGSGPVAEQPAPAPAAAGDHTHVPPEPAAAPVATTTGRLDYDRYHRWSTGGRVAYFPIPAIELGGSLHVARVDPVDHPLSRILIASYGLDANYNAVIPALKGTIDAHAEWILSRAHPADRASWPADRSRQGLYAQLAYRPSELDAVHASRLEGVMRFDRLDGASGDKPTRRYTAGLNYWIQPSLVAKTAVQLTDPYRGDRTRRVMLQLAGGF